MGDTIHCDLMVIGAGTAGMAAAGFAARHGLTTVGAGAAGEIIYASGCIDVLGVHPTDPPRPWADPWAGIEALRADQPDHPYAKIPIAAVKAAVTDFVSELTAAGLPYRIEDDRNTWVLTPAGTRRPTYAVPASLWAGAEALDRGAPCLIVGIEGLKRFSAEGIAAVSGPSLRAARIRLPDFQGEVYAEPLARFLETDPGRSVLAEAVRPHLGEAEAVGFPAVLGVGRVAAVTADLSDRLGRPVFEIPTLPPSVTGLRLREALFRMAPQWGVRPLYPLMIEPRPRVTANGGFDLTADGGLRGPIRIRAKAVILATGRFVGGGLRADRGRIREPLFDLPVRAPDARSDWHRIDFFDSRGHPVNRGGLTVDATFRPVDETGRPVYDRLFAAGAILAHGDWTRTKCGSGMAIATAWAAVSAAAERISGGG